MVIVDAQQMAHVLWEFERDEELERMKVYVGEILGLVMNGTKQQYFVVTKDGGYNANYNDCLLEYGYEYEESMTADEYPRLRKRLRRFVPFGNIVRIDLMTEGERIDGPDWDDLERRRKEAHRRHAGEAGGA